MTDVHKKMETKPMRSSNFIDQYNESWFHNSRSTMRSMRRLTNLYMLSPSQVIVSLRQEMKGRGKDKKGKTPEKPSKT